MLLPLLMVNLQKWHCWRHHVLESGNLMKSSWCGPGSFTPLDRLHSAGWCYASYQKRRGIVVPILLWTLCDTTVKRLATLLQQWQECYGSNQQFLIGFKVCSIIQNSCFSQTIKKYLHTDYFFYSIIIYSTSSSLVLSF